MSGTIYDHLKTAAECHPDRVALMHKVRGEYVGMSYAELMRDIESVAAGMRRLGIRKGDSIGIFSGNRPEWVIVDLAALKLGCVVVPIHPQSSAAYFAYIAVDSRIKMVFVENEKSLRIVRDLPGYLSPCKIMVLFDDAVPVGGGNTLTFSQLKATRPQNDNDHEKVTDSDVATVVYTSGTTGEPKGVILTHRNIVSNVLAVQRRFEVTSEDTALSYLPLSHMFERTCGYYAILFAGGMIAYAGSPATVAEDVQTIRPTLLLAVPSVIEKAYHRVTGEIRSGSSLRRMVVSVAIRFMNAHVNRRHKGKRIPYWLRAAFFLCNRYVAFQFRQLAGGRLRIVASGGAPLDRKIAKLYHIVGLNIVEGYGLTETSPIVACHTLHERELGTVGKPLDGVEVRIGLQNEILVRGPNVMRGYLNKPEETVRVIDADGWLHTGDQGTFDSRNSLIITGRIKDIIVMSNGEKVAAAAIESRLARSEYILQAVLFGDRKKFIAALIVPNREQVERFARLNRIRSTDYAGLLCTQEIREMIRRQIEATTENALPHERIRAFSLLAEPFTVENELLTPTLKVRRDKIAKQYCDVIEGLFEFRPSAVCPKTSEMEYAN